MADLFPSSRITVSVLTPLPLGPLDYSADAPLEPGTYVVVPVSGRETVGVVWGPGTAGPDGAITGEVGPGSPSGIATRKNVKLKAVIRLLDLPPMPAPMRRFMERAARYTLTPLGMMLRQATRAPGLATPEETRTIYTLGTPPDRMTEARQRVLDAARADPGLSAADLARAAGTSSGVIKGLHETGALISQSAPKDRAPPRLDPDHLTRTLNPEQQTASDAIVSHVKMDRFAALLLDGVTGSGKTETYLEAVADVVRQGRQALILLPEIALTADFIRRVRERFGAPPVEWHSGITPAARRKAWRAIARGEAQVVAGARSALFLPYKNLALIVVDEEHDQSYKQEDVVLYQARDLSVLRAAEEQATVVLASATPSLESWVNAENGKYERLTLLERHGDAILPFLSAIDIRADPPERGTWLSPPLVEATRDAMSRKEQVLYFLNRRGYAPLTLCRKCGWRAGCPNCSAWLVEHKVGGALICHQCGHRTPAPAKCPDCGDPDHLAACGPGVERIAEEAAERFPLADVQILSSDLAPDPTALKQQILDIAQGKADIIVGTQIVAKGHNFPNLTLVGVVDADLGLMGGDLRASERTFQMLNQVAGRAGRADKPGRAMLQTAQPEHPVLQAILAGDAAQFRQRLADERRMGGMPPYARLVAVIVRGENEEKVWDIAKALAANAAPLTDAGCDVFGPAPAPFAMLRGEYRVRLLVRLERIADHAALIEAWRAQVKVPASVRVVFDVDPYSFL